MKEQTITIKLLLKHNQVPYSSAVEDTSQRFEGEDYGSLVQFFHDLDPSYVVLGINSEVANHNTGE
jgi:hypothetical protein